MIYANIPGPESPTESRTTMGTTNVNKLVPPWDMGIAFEYPSATVNRKNSVVTLSVCSA
jgi:hypothetical protein